jgi:hypothetical protein
MILMQIGETNRRRGAGRFWVALLRGAGRGMDSGGQVLHRLGGPFERRHGVLHFAERPRKNRAVGLHRVGNPTEGAILPQHHAGHRQYGESDNCAANRLWAHGHSFTSPSASCRTEIVPRRQLARYLAAGRRSFEIPCDRFRAIPERGPAAQACPVMKREPSPLIKRKVSPLARRKSRRPGAHFCGNPPIKRKRHRHGVDM